MNVIDNSKLDENIDHLKAAIDASVAPLIAAVAALLAESAAWRAIAERISLAPSVATLPNSTNSYPEKPYGS